MEVQRESPFEIGIDQSADIVGDGQAQGLRPGDDDLFVGGGKTQVTRPVAVAVLCIPFAVGFLPCFGDRHDGLSPF